MFLAGVINMATLQKYRHAKRSSKTVIVKDGAFNYGWSHTAADGHRFNVGVRRELDDGTAESYSLYLSAKEAADFVAFYNRERTT